LPFSYIYTHKAGHRLGNESLLLSFFLFVLTNSCVAVWKIPCQFVSFFPFSHADVTMTTYTFVQCMLSWPVLCIYWWSVFYFSLLSSVHRELY
jgi:hypothetical protein